jgi:hypothetical protein
MIVDFGYILQVIKQIESELPRDDAPSYVSAAPSTPAAVHASVNASVQVEERNGSSRPAQPVAPSDFRVNEESYIQSISQQKLKLSSGEQVLSEKHFNKMVVRAVNPDFYGKPLHSCTLHSQHSLRVFRLGVCTGPAAVLSHLCHAP